MLYGYRVIEDKNLMVLGTIPVLVFSARRKYRGIIRHKNGMIPDPNYYIIEREMVIVAHPSALAVLYAEVGRNEL